MTTRLGFCGRCAEQGREVAAVQILDGDAYFRACLRTAGESLTPELPALPLLRVPKVGSNLLLCVKGCGQHRHRGRCHGPHIFRSHKSRGKPWDRVRAGAAANVIGDAAEETTTSSPRNCRVAEQRRVDDPGRDDAPGHRTA